MSVQRRVIGLILRATAHVLAVLALLGFEAWLIGAIMSDRTVWSQWLSWIPTTATVAGMGLCVAGSWCAARLARGVAPRSPAPGVDPKKAKRTSAFWMRRVAFVLTLGLGVYMVGIQWHLWRLVVRAPLPAGKVCTLLYWNHAGNWSLSWMDTTSRELSDITVLNAPRYWEYMPQLMEKIGKEHTEKYHYQRVDSYAVISRWPIVRWAKIDLNLPTIQTKLDPYANVYERGWYWNRGGACWIEFDTKDALGKNLIAWIIDMPSDPRLHREEIARIGGQTIRSWNGAPMERGPVGQFMASKQKMTGFPEADVIFGDFNIPRGARSLRHLVGDARGAFEEVGVGAGGTYPARVPLLGIDQIFTRGDTTAATYRVFHPGFGMHKAQQATLVVHPKVPGG